MNFARIFGLFWFDPNKDLEQVFQDPLTRPGGAPVLMGDDPLGEITSSKRIIRLGSIVRVGRDAPSSSGNAHCWTGTGTERVHAWERLRFSVMPGSQSAILAAG